MVITIPAFWLGVIATVAAEIIAVIVYGIAKRAKEAEKDGKEF